MRLIGFVLLFLILSTPSWGQTPLIDKLINEGIGFYDTGKYDEAIQKYEKVLELSRSNLTARYELALTFYTKCDYDKAIDHSRIVMQAEGEYYEESALIYGASLENQNKSKRAVKVFEMAIAKHPDNAQLHYNAALSYFKLKGYNTAERHVTLSLDQDIANPAGHLLLANIMLAKGEKLKCMMSLYYYLLIEQDSERTPKAFELLQNIWEYELQNAKNNRNTAAVTEMNSFKMTEISMGKLLVNDTTQNEMNRFQVRTSSFLKAISETQWDELFFWKTRYIDFFSHIHQKGYDNSYAAFISQCKYKVDVMTWISDHYPQFGSFTDWMEKQ
jgi:tetratricopeptide (TPR) repeat protein